MTPAVLSVIKLEGAGGTQFWTTAPKPIAVISTDTNTEATARSAFGMSDDDEFDEDICRFKQVSMPALVFDEREDVKEEAEGKFEEIIDFLRPMVKDEDARPKTLVFDTATDVYDLGVLGTFGKTDQIHPEVRKNMMGRVNTSYKGIIQAFKDRGVHVILVHRARELWEDVKVETQKGTQTVRQKMTGAFDLERIGFKETGFITNVEVALAFKPNREGRLSDKFGMAVTRCNPRPLLIGRKFWGKHDDDLHKASFPFLMSQVYKGTSPKDWE